MGITVLISDTVGFIRNLPHDLIASFRSTLGEIRDVDLLLKVFDASSDTIHEHIETVEEVLKDLNLSEKSGLTVMNKIDTIQDLEILKGLKKRFQDASFISSKEKFGIDALTEKMSSFITSEFKHDVFHLSFKQTKLLDTIYELTHVLNKKSDYDGINLEVEGSRKSLDKIRQILEK